VLVLRLLIIEPTWLRSASARRFREKKKKKKKAKKKKFKPGPRKLCGCHWWANSASLIEGKRNIWSGPCNISVLHKPNSTPEYA
jgi:hypothetical protein